MSSSHHKMFGRRYLGIRAGNVDWRYMIALVVPCRTRLGVYIPSGVMNDCHSRENLEIGNCQSRAIDRKLQSILISQVLSLHAPNWAPENDVLQ